MRYRGAPALTAVQQFVNLKINSICEGEGGVRLGMLNWEFAARPDPLSRLYRVRVEFQQGGVPQVYVVDPDLNLLAEGRKLPHVYDQTRVRLCLYLPGTGEWSPSRRISETIVPWTFLWLWYFEEWLVSDAWKGGGLHPRPLHRTARPRINGTGRKCYAER